MRDPMRAVNLMVLGYVAASGSWQVAPVSPGNIGFCSPVDKGLYAQGPYAQGTVFIGIRSWNLLRNQPPNKDCMRKDPMRGALFSLDLDRRACFGKETP